MRSQAEVREFATKRRIILKTALAGGAGLVTAAVLGRRGQDGTSTQVSASELFPTGDFTPYQMAMFPTHGMRLRYAQLKFGFQALSRRAFEPEVAYPATVDVWTPYVMKAVAEENEGLDPYGPQAVRTSEISLIVLLETCGARVDSSSAALWPAGIVGKYHPEVAAAPQDRWINIRVATRYYAQGLRNYLDAGQTEYNAVRFGFVHYYGEGKELTPLYLSLADHWLTEGQAFVDERAGKGMCIMAQADPGWNAWQKHLMENQAHYGLNIPFAQEAYGDS